MKGKLLILVLLPLFIFGQETHFVGSVFNSQTRMPMENVNVVNLNQVKGTTTSIKGDFSVRAAVNDTIYFSFLGFKSVKVTVTNDMIKYPGTRIGMSELAYALEEVVITPYRLTGYLEIDAKHMPVNDAQQYYISSLNKTYETMSKSVSVSKGSNILSKFFNLFSKKENEMKRLKKMREDDNIRQLLSTKFDRDMIAQVLKVDKGELYKILKDCNLSDQFINEANDIQILEALTNCYDEDNVTRGKK